MAGKKLTQKKIIFAQKFVELGNASEAYRHSYSTKNMKAKTVTENASRLMSDSNVLAMIEELQKEAQKRTEVTIDKLVHEASHSAFFDPRKMFNELGQLKDIGDLDESTARAISEITVRIERSEEGELPAQVVKIKANDKLGAIDKLLRHLGGYDKDNQQKNKVVVSSLNDFYASLGDGKDSE